MYIYIYIYMGIILENAYCFLIASNSFHPVLTNVLQFY